MFSTAFLMELLLSWNKHKIHCRKPHCDGTHGIFFKFDTISRFINKTNPWNCLKRVRDVSLREEGWSQFKRGIAPSVIVYLICAFVSLEVWGGRSVIKHRLRRLRSVPLRADLTSLVPPQFSHWLRGRKTRHHFLPFTKAKRETNTKIACFSF